MSLSSVLESTSVSPLLRRTIRNPGLVPRPPLLVPRVAASPQRVGVAFDYALRFGLAARYRAKHVRLLARSAHWTYASAGFPGLARRAMRAADRAIGAIEDSDLTRELSPAAARACLLLVPLDLIRRGGPDDDFVGRRRPTKEEVDEVRALYEVVPWSSFAPRYQILLNPDFRLGSDFIGGADADLLVDNDVIDIKVIRESRMHIDYVRQLVGYALLAREFGVAGRRGKVDVRRVGVYFARSGCLHRVLLSECIAEADHFRVLRRLMKAARAPWADWWDDPQGTSWA